MKKNLLLACFILCDFLSFNLYAQTKYAVIVAIGKFESPEIPQINSLNDVPFIKNTLLSNGFEPENIICLENKNASKENILKTINSDLASKLKKGDVVVLHFSTHGICLKDVNGDETDGYDETLVCYDTPYRFPPNYSGEKHLIDDEINILLTHLRSKLGKNGQILLLVDACYSGTISRGNECFRTFISSDDDKNIKLASHTRHKDKKMLDIVDGQALVEPNLAPLIVISASSQDEANSETTDMNGKPVGSLSYAFSKAMQQKQKNENYKQLFDFIKTEMAITVPRQAPQIEGYLDEIVFNSKMLSKSNNSLKAKTYLTDSTFILNAGGLAQIMEGCTIDLFSTNLNTNDSSVNLSSGKVISANEFESKVLLAKTLTKTQILQAKIVIKSRSFASLQQNVLLSIKKSEKVKKLLSKQKIIQFVNKEKIVSADLLLEERKLSLKQTQLIFLFKNIEDSIFVNLPDNKPKTIAEIIKNKVINYAKSNYFRRISELNPKLNVELKIVPIEYKEINNQIKITKKYDENTLLSTDRQLVMTEGSVFILRAINKGTQRAYLNIFDIQSDNNITLLIPSENMLAENVFLNPNDSIDFDGLKLQISPPYGTEMLKLIASEKPMGNLKAILGNTQSRSLSTNTQTNSPFDVLISGSLNTSSRSLKKVNVPANDINVCTKIIQIVGKE